MLIIQGFFFCNVMFTRAKVSNCIPNNKGVCTTIDLYEGGTKKIRRGFLTLCMQLPKAKLFPRFIVV